jgi:hypothetical protein
MDEILRLLSALLDLVYNMSMKESDKQATAQILIKLENGTASRNDVAALLMYLREELNDNDPLKDVAHCVAHSDRDRGFAFNYINKFVNHFLEVATSGGVLQVEILFPLADIIDSLINALKLLKIPVNEGALKAHMSEVRNLLSNVIADTKINIHHPKVTSCQFQEGNDGKRDLLSFTVYFNQAIQGALQIPTNVGMGFPVLD